MHVTEVSGSGEAHLQPEAHAVSIDLVLSSNKREGSLLSLSTNWAQREEIVACLEALLKRDVSRLT